jgi:Peptidase A4 family
VRRALVVVLLVFGSFLVSPEEAGAMPLIDHAYAVPSILGPAGGTVTVLAWQTSWGPATCRVRFDGTSLRGEPPPALVYSIAPRPCQYTVVARVTIGRLPSSASQALSFTLIVRSAHGSMAKAFSVSVERERLWADTGGPVEERTSRNWSGYALKGGPYTAVTGTFQLPLIFSTSACRDTYSQWVGIDGVGNQDLLQAGISEQMSNVWGVCTRHPQVWAWWETLPGPEAPFVTLPVRPGQSVTVTIAEVFTGWWFVGVFNNSTGREISTQVLYNGPHSSAEWVVEAPSSTLCSTGAHFEVFSVCNMAGFAGQARFTGLDAVGPSKEMAEVDLVQHGVQVANPSPVWSLSQLLAQGFYVAYSGLGRPAPSPILTTEPTGEHERP